VWQLAQADRLPFRVSRNGVRLFRRRQLETIANSWLAQRLQRRLTQPATQSRRAV
jgi:hypothetical protein